VMVLYGVAFVCFRHLHVLPPSKKRRAIEKYLLEVVAPTVPILPYDASAAE